MSCFEKNTKPGRWTGLIAMLGLFLSACGPLSAGDLAAAAAVPTTAVSQPAAVLPTALLTPPPPAQVSAPSPAPTALPPATATAAPTTAPTVAATVTPSPTIAPTLTPRPSPTTEPARYCPDPPPLKPIYDRFFLSPDKWPEPDEALAGPHFWMARPFADGGLVPINQRFPYGWDDNGRLLLHNGVDTAEDLGTPVLAVADGTVVVAQGDAAAWYGWRCDWYGHLVVLELDQRWNDQPVYALYGHILNLVVEPGQRVTRGQPLAEVGIGGAATSPHLHFEVRVGENEFGATRNPMLWLEPGPARGVIAGRLIDPEGRPWQGVPLALVSEETNAVAHSTWSYLGDPQGIANADEGWAENFVFADVLPGIYRIVTEIQDVVYEVPVFVNIGEVAVVALETEAYKTPTPALPEPLETAAPAYPYPAP
jgi:murein DD-endopeptidase MepM/ murein hydrolase activator NlpD